MAIETIPGAAAGDLTTLLGTTGADTIETSETETKDLFIDALAGDDDITATAGLTNIQVEGDEGNDTLTFEGFIFGSDRRIQGGQDNDTISFQKDVEDLMVRGGKDDDSIKFQADIENATVYGDQGTDVIDLDGETLTSEIYGGTNNDTVKIAGRFDTSTIFGGDGDDSIEQDAAAILDGASINGEAGDDTIKFGNGKIEDSKVQGAVGADTIELLANATLTTGKLEIFGGKDDDSVKLSAATKNVTVYGDKGDDTLNVAGAMSAVTLFGGDGDDVTANGGNGTTFQNGNAGDDTLVGGTAKDTIYGGSGDDTITAGANDDKLYGSKGDDSIAGEGGNDYIEGGAGDDVIKDVSAGATDNNTLYGGDGDDDIEVGVAAAANAVDYTLSGGAGVDTITIEDLGTNGTALLEYASFAEFYSSGDSVDVITMDNDDTGTTTTIEVAGTLKFDSADEFDNITLTNGKLTLATAKSVTGGSNVVLDTAEAALFETIDVSAGTTGSTKIDLSSSTAAHTIKGSKSGRNTLTGGDEADVITGGSGNDTVTGNLKADTIDFGSGGKDIFTTAVGDSVAATATNDGENNAWVDGDAWGTTAATITFGNGLDVISGFTSDDIIDGLGATMDMSNLGAEAGGTKTLGDIAADKLVVGYGTFDATNKVFTTAAAFNATNAKDAYVTFTKAADAAGLSGATNTTSLVLDDLTVALADANFTA